MEALKAALANLQALEARNDLIDPATVLSQATRELARATAEAVIEAAVPAPVAAPKKRAAPRRAAPAHPLVTPAKKPKAKKRA